MIAFGSPVDTRVALPLGHSRGGGRVGRRPPRGRVRQDRGAGVDEPDRLPAARPGQVAAPAGRLRPPASRPRGAAAARAPAPLPRWARAGSPGPGPAVADFMRQFIAHNRMLQGGFVIEDRTVTLADIACPVLTVVGEVDEIAPARRGARDHAAPRRGPRSTSWRCAPGTSASWSGRRRRRSPGRRSPAGSRGARRRAACRPRSAASATTRPSPRRRGVGTRLGVGLELAAGVGGGLARSVAGAASRTAGGIRVLAEEVDRPAAAAGAPGAARPAHARLARAAARRAGARRARRRTSSCSRTAPTRTRPSSAASTTWSAACSRWACARASTSAC